MSIDRAQGARVQESFLLIFVPTYNEAENIRPLYKALREHAPQATILLLDDNSPDGTGIIMDDIAVHDSSVVVIHRAGKLGLGTAHRLAFSYAREQGFTWLLTMDADFTHDPRYIPALLAQREKNDIVIGSRYARGGGLENWGPLRTTMTYTAHGVTKYVLGMPYDCTGAYRLYRVSKLDQRICDQITSNGYSFFIESLYRLKKSGCSIAQVPIVAPIRHAGASKISKWEIARTIMRVGVLAYDRMRMAVHRETNVRS